MNNSSMLHKNTKDLMGCEFGRLKVIGFAGYFKETPKTTPDKTAAYWFAQCNCNKSILVRGLLLSNGHVSSCGCYKRDTSIAYCKATKTKHSLCKTKLYYIWTGLRTRCNNPKNKYYTYYGGKGVTYSKEWEDFITFKEWAISSGYQEGLTIDRIDSNGDYTPENCRWVPLSDQQKNKTNAVLLTLHGETKSVAEWARQLNISDSVIRSRLKAGYSDEEALLRPVAKKIRKKVRNI